MQSLTRTCLKKDRAQKELGQKSSRKLSRVACLYKSERFREDLRLLFNPFNDLLL